jgi:hypothetical protein
MIMTILKVAYPHLYQYSSLRAVENGFADIAWGFISGFWDGLSHPLLYGERENAVLT